MKQATIQSFIVGVLMFCSTTSMPIFSSTVTDKPVDLKLASKEEVLSQLDQLLTSNESLQRTYLVRHGESTANVYFEIDGKKVRYVSGQSTDIPLTETGREQIFGLAKNLSERFPKHAQLIITSSSAVRTQQTAKIIFDELAKTHSSVTLAEEVYVGLNERHLGAWEGQLKDENYFKAEEAWKAMSAAEKFVSAEVVGGESYTEVASRALPALSEIYSRYSDSTVIAVTSFNTINAIAIQMNNIEARLSTIPGTNFPKLDLDNGDLVLLETSKSLGFAGTQVISHIKHEK
jgi:broad specificity phosphatase PhoE